MTARILVVEDDPTLLQSVVDYLGHQGYEVKGAPSGTEALALLKEPWDLVITDLMLPDHDGIDLLQAVKGAKPQAAVVVITAHGSIESAVTAMKGGAADYLTKPFRLAQLREVVQRVIASLQQAATPAIPEVQPPVPQQAQVVEIRPLWKRARVPIPASFKDEFSWIPSKALVIFTGLTDAHLWQFAMHSLCLRLQEGHGIVYALAEDHPERFRSQLNPFFPEEAIEEGVVAFVDLSSLWVRIERETQRVRVAGLEELVTALMTTLNRHLMNFDQVTLLVDPLSTVCSMLDERGAVQLARILRGITREFNATVYGTLYREGLTTAVRSVIESVADVVISLERDPLRDVLRYEVTKGLPADAPRVNELRTEGPFLVPVKAVSRKYGYVRCAQCRQEFFVAFGSRAPEEGQFICDQCSGRTL